jgi:hypothetical protein
VNCQMATDEKGKSRYVSGHVELASSCTYPFTKAVLFSLLTLNLATKIFLVFCFACVFRPIGWRRTPENILQIQSRATFDEQPHHFLMPRSGSLMQRCRVRMPSQRIVSVWILSRIKQQSNDLDMSKIRRQTER